MKNKKNNKDLMVFIHDDQPNKITKKIISIKNILLYILIASASVIVMLNHAAIINSIKSNIHAIRKIDSRIDNYSASHREIRVSYDSLRVRLKKIATLEDSIKRQSKAIAPEIYRATLQNKVIKSQKDTLKVASVEDLSKEAANLREFFLRVLALYNSNSNIFNYTPTAFPVDTPLFISRKYGKYIDPLTNTKKLHEGFDFRGNIGDPVYASAKGTVLRTGNDLFFGRFIEIRHRDGITTYYSHLDRVMVSQGQQVAKGKKIGTLGKTGAAISPNLHFEIRENSIAVDPRKYLIKLSPM